MSDHIGRPGLDSGQLPGGRHSVVASMPDIDAARLLMEDLEEHGVPPGSIALRGAVDAEQEDADLPEAPAFEDVTRSTVGGAVVGSVVGGLLGALLTIPFPGLNLFWAIVLGAVFGGGIGIAAGGMSVAKYSSPAWRESYDHVEGGDAVTVGVHADDEGVVTSAERLMRSHGPLHVQRLDDHEA